MLWDRSIWSSERHWSTNTNEHVSRRFSTQMFQCAVQTAGDHSNWRKRLPVFSSTNNTRSWTFRPSSTVLWLTNESDQLFCAKLLMLWHWWKLGHIHQNFGFSDVFSFLTGKQDFERIFKHSTQISQVFWVTSENFSIYLYTQRLWEPHRMCRL